jgi:hypothetical protein
MNKESPWTTVDDSANYIFRITQPSTPRLGPANPDGFSAEMLAEYTATFADTATLRAALNWYNGAMEAGTVACPPVLAGSPFEGNAEFAATIAYVPLLCPAWPCHLHGSRAPLRGAARPCLVFSLIQTVVES